MDSNSQGDPEQNPPSPSPSLLLPVLSGGGAANKQEARSLPGVGSPGFMGKHRMAAAIAYLDQQIQIIQEELDQLETLGESSIVCKELIASIESIPDALLPETKGPVDIVWDRWFQGGHGSRNRKRWI